MRPPRTPPGPGQESAWDYPRPPRVEPSTRRVRVVVGDLVIADSNRAHRVLETGHPPTWYVPPDDVLMEVLVQGAHETYCEFKGVARYFDVVVGERRIRDAAWTYPRPSPGFEALAYQIAFFPGRADACFIDGERVTPQPGAFYGGWITTDVVGPFKGEPGSYDW